MDAVMEFFIEGMQQAPVAFGALVGFALAGLWLVTIEIPRERRQRKAFQAKLDQIMGRDDENEGA